MPPRPFASRVILWLFTGLLALPGAACLWLASLPYASLRSYLDRMAFDGSADAIPREVFLSWITPLYVAAALFWALALACQLLRRPLLAAIDRQLDSLPRVLADGRALAAQVLGEDKIHLWTLGLIMLMGAAVRLWFLEIPMKYDEAHTFMEYALKSPLVAMTYYTAPNNHLFHNLLVHICFRLLGDAEWALRLPAFMAGILVMPASYVAFRQLYDRRVGLLSAALMAGASVMVEYSVAARGYSMMTLFFLLMLSLSVYARRSKEPFAWILWALLAGLGLHNIPLMLFPCATLVIWWFLPPVPHPQEVSWWRRWQVGPLLTAGVAGLLLAVFLYSPILVSAGWRAILANPHVELKGQYPAQLIPLMAGFWRVAVRDLPWPVLVLILGGIGLTLSLDRARARQSWKLALAAILGALPACLITGAYPPPRTWVYLVPIFMGLGSAGVVWLVERPRWPRPAWREKGLILLAAHLAGLLVWVVAMSPAVISSEHAGDLPDGPQVAARIRADFQKGDGVLTFCPADEPLAYYFRRQGLPVRLIFEQEQIKAHPRIWIVAKTDGPPSLKWLWDLRDLTRAGYSQPRLIQRYPRAALYLAQRQPAATPAPGGAQ